MGKDEHVKGSIGKGIKFGSGVCSHLFELKNWFEMCVSRWFYIEIRNFNISRGLRFAILMIITNLNAKSTVRAPFELFFEFKKCERIRLHKIIIADIPSI
jgi:hypothetical protein